jgi:DNA-binding response OmpR family regulator
MDALRKKILILDRDEQVLIDLEQVLENAGFETTTTWDMEEALNLLSGRDFDLLLLGDHPPEVSGAELLKGLRSRGSSAPCIVLRCAPRFPFEDLYLCRLGAYAVVSKSKDCDLVATIRECLGVPEASGEDVTRRAAG